MHAAQALPLAASETLWVWNTLGLLSIPLLVALNGLFVAAEFALVAVRKTRVEELVRRGQLGAKAVEDATANLDRSIASTELGITLASIALGWAGEAALARLLEPMFRFLPDTWSAVTTHSLAVGLALLSITFLHVVFGELIPKTMALQKPDGTALWVAGPRVLVVRLTRPLIALMNGTGNGILRLCGFRPATSTELAHSIEELSLLIEDTEEAGILGAAQAEFVQRVFRLSAKRVRDCMVPRDKMAVLELNSPPDMVLEAARRGAHTRMPVYERELDNIVGIVNTKDLFYLFSLKGVVILEDALYLPLFLKPDEEVANAFHLFRKAHRPIALVQDDEGKIRGLLTLENVLEEIVGDIEDEHDRPPDWHAETNASVQYRESVHRSGMERSLGDRRRIRRHRRSGSDV
jgi:CBS domain containing-hemolysin-like protein